MLYHKNNILTRAFVVARACFRLLLHAVPSRSALLLTFFDIFFFFFFWTFFDVFFFSFL